MLRQPALHMYPVDRRLTVPSPEPKITPLSTAGSWAEPGEEIEVSIVALTVVLVKGERVCAGWMGR